MIDESPSSQPGVADRERGASLVEYALLVALIAVACAVAISFLGAKTSGGLSSSASSIFGA